MSDWNAKQYSIFERERSQAVCDLISRIEGTPRTILDIGCGPGSSTIRLAEKFPHSSIIGADSSDNMLTRARESYPELCFVKCDVPRELDSLDRAELIFSNACLHWIPEHDRLLPALMERVENGGQLAVQMPLTERAEFYQCLYRLTERGKWARLRDVHNFHNFSPENTYNVLAGCSDRVKMWETVYYHIMPSHEAIIEWYKGSGLRPYLERLTEDEGENLISELLEMLRNVIPVTADGTVILKMPRMFFIAIKI